MKTKRVKRGCQAYVPFGAVAVVVRKDHKVELALPEMPDKKAIVPDYVLHTMFFAMAIGEPDCRKILDRMVKAVVNKMQKKIDAAKKLSRKAGGL